VRAGARGDQARDRGDNGEAGRAVWAEPDFAWRGCLR
jgi:hypothetical protein